MSDIYAQLNYLFAKHPEVKPCFTDPKGMEKLSKISFYSKTILVTEDKDEWRWYALRRLMIDPKKSMRVVDMGYALDVFTGNIEDEKSLSYITSDILVIRDGRLKMSHSQKEVLLAQLWDSAPIVIYEWLGDSSSYKSRCQLDEMQRKEAHIIGNDNQSSSRTSRTTQSELF